MINYMGLEEKMYKIFIYDDSIGSIGMVKNLRKNLYRESFVFFADTISYPMALRRKSASTIALARANYFLDQNPKVILVVNPTLAYYLNGIQKVVTAFESYKDLLKSHTVIGASNLKNFYSIDNFVDGQLLINAVNDGGNLYISDKIIESLVGGKKDVFLFDTGLSLIKDRFKKHVSGEVISLNDLAENYFIKYMEDKKWTLKFLNGNIKYIVSENRKDFYTNAEKFTDFKIRPVYKFDI